MSKDVDAAELSGDEAYRSKKKEPLSLTFDGVVVGIPAENGVAGGERLILNGVSGYCEPGSVTALMGATGSGKTTLLSALANRLEAPTRLSTASRIRYGGEAWSKSLKRLVGFVEQDDIVVPELTVRQTLRFAARLRLPADTEDSALKLERRVNEVIDQLALGKCVDTPIGNGEAAHGVSGGERKRVCIASELLAEPRLLFLDEPTSGLDSETALVLVRSLRRLAAEEGVTIVCSIHQPNSQVFTNFQQLCFLHAGRMVFFGEAQAASLAHFSGLVGSKCPAHYNPPDWYMELAVGGKLDQNVLQQDGAVSVASGAPPLPPTTTTSPTEEQKKQLELYKMKQQYYAPFSTQIAVLGERMLRKLVAMKVTMEQVNIYFINTFQSSCAF